MKSLVFLSIMLIPLALFAQVGEKISKSIDGFDYECSIDEGRLKCKRCEKTGEDLICEVRNYDEKGRLSLNGFTKNGLAFGIWTSYAGKKLIKKMSYRDGIRHGLTEYYVKDKLWGTLTYNNDTLEGEIKSYLIAQKGNDLNAVIPISNGLVHGELIVYNRGVIFVKTNYVHGVRQGQTFMYDGDCIGEVTFNQGKADGNLLLKDVEGKPSSEFVLDPSKTYFNKYIEYNKDGSIKKARQGEFKLLGGPDDVFYFTLFDELLAAKIVLQVPVDVPKE